MGSVTITRKPYTRAAAYDPIMNLPKGKTCGDCRNFERCGTLCGHIAADEVCDWYPLKFKPKMASKNRKITIEIASDTRVRDVRVTLSCLRRVVNNKSMPFSEAAPIISLIPIVEQLAQALTEGK